MHVVLLIIISIELVVTCRLFLYQYQCSVIIVITFDTKESPLIKETPSLLRQNAPISFEE